MRKHEIKINPILLKIHQITEINLEKHATDVHICAYCTDRNEKDRNGKNMFLEYFTAQNS